MKKWENPSLSNLNLESTSTICPLAITYTWECDTGHCETDSIAKVEPGGPCPTCGGTVIRVCGQWSES